MTTASRRVLVGAVITAALGCAEPQLGIPPAACSTHAVSVRKGELMEPGGTCIDCHAAYEGPSFVLAGSVMNAQHDDTNCAGVANVTVAITGADGKRVELVSNDDGNFKLERWPGTNLYPYTAEVSRGGVTSKMLTPRQKGEDDCNSCHTSIGVNSAPGRILAP